MCSMYAVAAVILGSQPGLPEFCDYYFFFHYNANALCMKSEESLFPTTKGLHEGDMTRNRKWSNRKKKCLSSQRSFLAQKMCKPHTNFKQTIKAT